MKPDWTKAPEWAKYIAMDSNGAYYWYATKPYSNLDLGEWMTNEGPSQRAVMRDVNWVNSLEPKPEE